MTRTEKALVIEDIFSRFYADVESEHGNEGMCLYWTHAACVGLALCGERPVLQAGTMLWPSVPDIQDAQPTHFGYEWTPTEPESREAILCGRLPEVHVWAALPDKGEVVDFSTRNLKAIARQKYGLPWTEPDPPRYVWATEEELPERVLYKPHLQAIAFILQFISRKHVGTKQ